MLVGETLAHGGHIQGVVVHAAKRDGGGALYRKQDGSEQGGGDRVNFDDLATWVEILVRKGFNSIIK